MDARDDRFRPEIAAVIVIIISLLVLFGSVLGIIGDIRARIEFVRKREEMMDVLMKNVCVCDKVLMIDEGGDLGRDPITLENLRVGVVYAQLNENRRSIYDPEELKKWFKNRIQDPLTRRNVRSLRFVVFGNEMRRQVGASPTRE